MATFAGENLNQYIAEQQAAKQPVIFDEVLFCYDSTMTETRLKSLNTMPAAARIMHRITPTTGYLNADSVVYSALLDSNVGDFNFNYLLLINKAKNLIALKTFTGQQTKTRTTTTRTGNNLVRNFILEFVAAKDSTGIQQAAQSWQIDFTDRLNGIDDDERHSNTFTFGKALFKNTAFRGVWTGTTAQRRLTIQAGKGYLFGLPVEMQNDVHLIFSTYPANVWLVAYQSNTGTGKRTVKTDIVTNGSAFNSRESGEYTELVGKTTVTKYFYKIASVPSLNNVTDLRESTPESLWDEIKAVKALANGKYTAVSATTAREGLVQLNNTLTSTSTTQALTAAQGKALNDKFVSATTARAGLVQLNNTLTSTSTTQALTAAQGKALNDKFVTATTARAGLVQLNNTLTSTSTTQALTAAQGKALNDKFVAATTTRAGLVQLNNTLTSTSTTQALTAAQGKALNDKFDSRVTVLSQSVNQALSGKANTTHLPSGHNSHNGWIEFHHGLIIQWGFAGTNTTTVRYPKPFPNNCFNVTFTVNTPHVMDNGNVILVGTPNREGFNWYCNGARNGVFWQAIGN